MSHADLLRQLLPPGVYDPNGALIGAELVAEGNALDRAQWSVDQILAEMDPRTTSALLADWERVYGLPESYVVASGVTQSSQERIAALVAKVTMRGGQSQAFFIALAASMGYTITITECKPHTTQHDTQHPVYDGQYEFIWFVNSALNTIRYSTTQDDTQMPTAVWGNALLEAVINRYKPAHTLALFSYS